MVSKKGLAPVKWIAPVLFIIVLLGFGFMYFSPQGKGDIGVVENAVKKIAPIKPVDCGTTNSFLSMEIMVESSLQTDQTLLCINSRAKQCAPTTAKMIFREFNASLEIMGFEGRECQYSLDFENEYEGLLGKQTCFVDLDSFSEDTIGFFLVRAVVEEVLTNPPYIRCE